MSEATCTSRFQCRDSTAAVQISTMQSEDYRLGTGHAKHVIDTTYKVGHRIVVLRNVDVAGAMFAVVYRCKALLLLAAAASG